MEVNTEGGFSCEVGGLHSERPQSYFFHPNEHPIAGKALDLECQLADKAAAGAIAVTRVSIRAGADHAFLKLLFDGMPQTDGPKSQSAVRLTYRPCCQSRTGILVTGARYRRRHAQRD